MVTWATPPCSFHSPPLWINLRFDHADQQRQKNELRKNPVGPNKCTDFEHFEFEIQVTERIFAMNWPNHPDEGNNLRPYRSTKHIIWRELSTSGPQQRRKIYGSVKKRYVKAKFSIYQVKQKCIFSIFSSHERPPCSFASSPLKIHFRFEHTDQQR